MSDREEYLVRGALLVCECGTHPRRLNLPMCHGVYALEHPLINDADCVVGKNINYFGICVSETPPSGAEEILMDKYVPEGEESTGEEITGPRCNPEIVGTWNGAQLTTKVGEGNCAVTTSGYLVCKNGGLIHPVTSGQEFKD